MKAAKPTAEDNSSEGKRRLRWAAVGKGAFEDLPQRLSTLNENKINIMDARLRTKIRWKAQATKRGVLQLHRGLSSLTRLVMALDITMQAHAYPVPVFHQYALSTDASWFRLIDQLARFKAFNETLDKESSAPWDEATACSQSRSSICRESQHQDGSI